MDVFIQTSLRDGLPNALLEAMACGKAVIGTHVGGILDAFTDCENGRLVSTNNVIELASATNELLKLIDERLRRKLRRAACQTIAIKSTTQAELEGNLAVYQRMGLKM